jgi:hypothetical protein
MATDKTGAETGAGLDMQGSAPVTWREYFLDYSITQFLNPEPAIAELDAA